MTYLQLSSSSHHSLFEIAAVKRGGIVFRAAARETRLATAHGQIVFFGPVGPVTGKTESARRTPRHRRVLYARTADWHERRRITTVVVVLRIRCRRGNRT